MPETHFIQSYAHVVLLDREDRIRALSSNVTGPRGEAPETLVGKPANVLLSGTTIKAARAVVDSSVYGEIPLGAGEPVAWNDRQVVPHQTDGGLLLEIEPTGAPRVDFSREAALRSINQGIVDAQTSQELLLGICAQLARYLSYDRVVVYDLQPDGSGIVTEEFNNGVFPKLKGMRYRADDFPLEAHVRYRKESVLSFAHANEERSNFVGDISGAEGAIQDCLGCRDIYPTLAQFNREEGILGYLSIALWDENELWGMIFAHADQPVYLDHQLRTFAYLVANLASQALVYRAFNQTHRQLLASEYIRTRIRENLASSTSLVEGLQRADPSLTELIPDTTGAAILLDGELVTIGITPPTERIQELLQWTQSKVGSRDVFATDNLPASYEGGKDLKTTAAGVLVIPLNLRCTEWIVWFRKERAEKVIFGSRSKEQFRIGGKRFSSTVEIRHGYSQAWTEENIEMARDLQTYIRDIIMERYSQLTRINHRLQVAYEELQAFSYTVSHDLRAPLRGIDGFAEILMEDYGRQLSPEGLRLIQVIQQNAARLNQYITDILELSRVGRVSLTITECNVEELVREALQSLNDQNGTAADVLINKPLPLIRGDARLLLTVFRHLLSNAIKYTAGREHPRVEVGYRTVNNFGDGEFYVADNGIGIDTMHQERVFGMFNRLVTQDDYAGNGVGLAVTRRILSRHNGEIRIESVLGQGATFLFYTDPNLATTSKQF